LFSCYCSIACQVILENMLKTSQFYEFILINIEFVEITHNQDVNNLVFSKIKIQKVLTFQDMNQNPYTFWNIFSKLPTRSSYFDYQQAWFILFFLKTYDHSSFIYFDQTLSKEFFQLSPKQLMVIFFFNK